MLVAGWLLLVALVAFFAYQVPASADASSTISCASTSPDQIRQRVTVHNNDIRPRRIAVRTTVTVNGVEVVRHGRAELVRLGGRDSTTLTWTIRSRGIGSARCTVESRVERPNDD